MDTTMVIDNRKDANKYYKLINELVDDYVDKWKIQPSKLKRYLKPGSDRFNKFLVRNKLNDIQGSDQILKDVIEDRMHMEKDGVIKFESFKFFESIEISSIKECLYKGIEKADINMEKYLADLYDTNLSDIDITDADKHIFNVNAWESKNIKVIAYTDDELNLIKENISEFLYNELLTKKVELTGSITIELKDIIKGESFTEKINNILTKDFVIKIITDYLENYKYKSDESGFIVWESR